MKVTAYKLVEEPLPIIPGMKQREWMNKTPYRFAYRCLPLSIANSTGWVIINPQDFLVTWNGGETKKDLTVHLDGAPFNYAESSFGSGIITFHTGYLFKTDKDWNMLVQGYPNFPIDFISITYILRE